MTDLAALEARVARLEARADISALVTRYARACDERDMDALLDCFAQDAVFTSPSGLMHAEGRAAIEAMFLQLFAVRGPGFHWTHDHLIEVRDVGEGRATGLIFSHAETSPGAVTSLAAMRYEDVYRREDRWRFERRSIAFLYYVPAADYASVLTEPNRLVAGDRRLPADWPEPLETWRAFAARNG